MAKSFLGHILRLQEISDERNFWPMKYFAMVGATGMASTYFTIGARLEHLVPWQLVTIPDINITRQAKGEEYQQLRVFVN